MRAWLRKPIVVGTLAAIITAAIGVTAILLIADAIGGDDASAAKGAEVAVSTTHSRPSTHRSTTTTTATGGSAALATTTTTGVPAGPSGAGTPTPSPTLPDTPDDDGPDPPDPRDAFQAGSVAPGISVSIGSCTWSPAAGGTLRATGTMSYTGPEDTFWDLEISWVVNNQGQDEELDSASDVYDLVSGQTISWDLSTTTEQPTPPPNLRCAHAVS